MDIFLYGKTLRFRDVLSVLENFEFLRYFLSIGNFDFEQKISCAVLGFLCGPGEFEFEPKNSLCLDLFFTRY